MIKEEKIGIFLKFNIKTETSKYFLNFRIKINNKIITYKLRPNQRFHELINIFIEKGDEFELLDKDTYEFEYEISKTPFFDEHTLKIIKENNIINNEEIYYNEEIYGNPKRLIISLTSTKMNGVINHKYDFYKGKELFLRDNAIYLSFFDLYNINGTGFLADNYEEPLFDRMLNLIEKYIEKYKIFDIYIVGSYKASIMAVLLGKKIKNSKLFLVSPITEVNEYFNNQAVHFEKFLKNIPKIENILTKTTIFYSEENDPFLKLEKFQNSKNISLNVSKFQIFKYVLEKKLILKEILEEFDIKYVERKNNSKKIIFIFKWCNPENEGNLDYERFARENPDFDFIWIEDYYEILDSHPNLGWYIEKYGMPIYKILARKIDALIKEKGYYEAYAMGSSKGGTGALIIGSNSLYISKIFSMVPQIDVANSYINISGKKIFSNNDYLEGIIEKNIAASIGKNIIIFSGSNEYPNFQYQKTKNILFSPYNNAVRLLYPTKINCWETHGSMVVSNIENLGEIMRGFFLNDINQNFLDKENIGDLFKILTSKDEKILYKLERAQERMNFQQLEDRLKEEN